MPAILPCHDTWDWGCWTPRWWWNDPVLSLRLLPHPSIPEDVLPWSETMIYRILLVSPKVHHLGIESCSGKILSHCRYMTWYDTIMMVYSKMTYQYETNMVRYGMPIPGNTIFHGVSYIYNATVKWVPLGLSSWC